MSDTPETDAQLTTFTSISKLKKHFVNRTGTVGAEFARRLERKRNAAERALTLIADDCDAWLVGESDEPSMEFIKLVAKYARNHLTQ